MHNFKVFIFYKSNDNPYKIQYLINRLMNFDQGEAEDGGDFENIENMLDDLGLGDQTNNTQLSKKDSTIFIIDCSKYINIQIQGESQPQLKIILDSYSNFLQKKIIGNTGDQVGLILYNVKNQSNSNFKNIFVMHKLGVPSATTIKEANSLYSNFEEMTGGLSQERAELQNVFWTYSDQIKKFSDNKFYLRLFLFTADDCPHEVGSQARSQAINQSRMLAGKGVQIQLFPLKKEKYSSFDIRKFYQEIITFDPDEINESVMDSSSKILDLKERLRQKQYKKRTLNRLLMKVGNQTEIGVKLYALYTKAKKPAPKKLDGASNRLLNRVNKKMNRDGKVMFDAQIGTYYPLGGQKVKLSKQDMNKIKSIQPPGMTLIGFKPKKLIKPYHNIKTSYFLYPDQEHVTGSSQFCDSLINQLVQRNLVGIVKLVPRNNQEMSFAALFPQKQHYDQQDHFQTPPGFNMIILPYADDIVNFVGDKTIAKPMQISEELLSVTNLLVNNLTINDFDFRNFENPSLQKFYSHLQTIALGEKDPVERPDLLLPDTAGLESFKEIIDLVIETVESDRDYFSKKEEEVSMVQQVQAKKQQDQDLYVSEHPQKKTRTKRQPKKKIKEQIKISSEQEYQDVDEINEKAFKKSKNGKNGKKVEETKSADQKLAEDVESMIIQGDTDSVKAADLKKYLTFHGMQSKGKKQELLNRALIFISERPCI